VENKPKYTVLEGELALINDPDIQAWTVETLKNAPEYFWYAPTSMTGKYHPAVCNLKGGLITHTKRVVYIANKLCHAWGIFAQNRDIVIAACILHDIAKSTPGEPYKEHVNHPLNAYKYFQTDKQPFVAEIDECIRNHMGRWSPRSVSKSIEEYSLIELAVYTADFLSSLKDLVTPRDKKSIKIKGVKK